jgi:hypothetical protein
MRSKKKGKQQKDGDTGTPELLWHYTNFQGLQGILQKQQIWASSLLSLNDTTEYEYSVELARQLLSEVRQRSVARYPLTRLGVEFLKNSGLKIISLEASRTFVACFSKSRDDLSQWRAYGGTPGFSIGFDRSSLNRLAKKSNFRLTDCRYSAEKHREKIRELVDSWISGLRKVDRNTNTRPDRRLLRKMARLYPVAFLVGLNSLAETNKHPKFRAEKEVRMVSGIDMSRNVQFRQSGSLVVPYVVIEPAKGGSQLPINEIIVGPCPHREAVSRSVEWMLEQQKVEAKVSGSSAPYRNW